MALKEEEEKDAGRRTQMKRMRKMKKKRLRILDSSVQFSSLTDRVVGRT